MARDGEILLSRGYGLADRTKKVPNGPTTLFEVSALSKQFTAAAVLRLASQGKLSIDDPVAKHLPKVPEAHRDVTIAHLLHHTSGFPRFGPSGSGADRDAAVARYLASTRRAKAGERFEYWNGGYALLAAVVEAVTKEDFREVCRRELFRPAGMTSTGFCGDADLDQALLARGYGDDDRDAGSASSHSFGWEYRGMGGVVTSAIDLHRWDRALRGDAILPEKERAILFEPALRDYACGWYVAKDRDGGRVAAHGGTASGFESECVRWLDGDSLVVVLANGRGTGWQVAHSVAEALRGQEFPLSRGNRAPPPPEVKDVSAEQLASLAGIYDLDGDGRFLVRTSGTGLVVGAEGQSAVDVLRPAAPGTAKTRPDPRRFREQMTRVGAMVSGIARGDAAPMSERLRPDFPRDWPERVLAIVWPAQVEERGALRTHRPIGAREERGDGGVRVWIRLDHEKRQASAEAILLPGDVLSVLRLDGPEMPVSASYAPTSATTFAAYDFGRPTLPDLRFERREDGAGAALLVRVPWQEEPLRAARVE